MVIRLSSLTSDASLRFSESPSSSAASAPDTSFEAPKGSVSPGSPAAFPSALSHFSNTSPLSSETVCDHSRSFYFSTLFQCPAVVHLISGATAGGISRTTTAPLDRLKVVLQVTRSTQRVAAFDTLRRLTQQEGYLSLFRGNGANCVKVVPECAIKFVAYDWFKRWLITARHSKEVEAASKPRFIETLETESAVPLSLGEKFLAGGSAGAVSQLVVYPLEVVKTRLATSKVGAYRGIADCVLKTFRYEGSKAFYRGFCPSLLGIIPYAGIDLACFETFKREYHIRFARHDEEPPLYIVLCSGAISSALGQIVAYPLALVRTRLQADGINGEARHFSGMIDVFRRTVQLEGVKALYRGLTPNLLKAVPAVSITWAVYENCKHALHEQYGSSSSYCPS